MCSAYADDIVTVSGRRDSRRYLALMERQKLVVARAVSVAAVMFNKLPLEGVRTCAIVSRQYRCEHTLPQ